MKFRKKPVVLAILCAAALSGCSTTGKLDNLLENRVVCTVAKDKAFVVSEYGPIGITGKIAEPDRAVICK